MRTTIISTSATGIGHLRIFLTPRTSRFQSRRVQYIAFIISGTEHSDFDWSELDRQVERLSALQVILLVFYHPDCLLEYCEECIPIMLNLSRSPKLKFVLRFREGPEKQLDNDGDEYVLVSLKDYCVEEVGEYSRSLS